MLSKQLWLPLLVLLALLAAWYGWRSQQPPMLWEQEALIERLYPQDDGGVWVLLSRPDSRAAALRAGAATAYELLAVSARGRLRWRTPLPGMASDQLPGQAEVAGGVFRYLRQDEPRRLQRVTAEGRIEPQVMPAPFTRSDMRLDSIALGPDGRKVVVFTTVRGRQAWLNVLATAPGSPDGRRRYRQNVPPAGDQFPLVWMLEQGPGDVHLLDVAWPGIKVAELGSLDHRLEWSPDANFLLLDQGSSAGSELIGVLDADGRNFRVVERDDTFGLVPAAWSKDSRYLYLAEWDRRRFWRYDPQQGQKTRVSSFQYRLAAELAAGPGLYLEVAGDAPDAVGPKQAFIYRPPPGLVEQLQNEADWRAKVAADVIPRALLFQGDDLREVTFSRDGQWAYAVITSGTNKRQDVCRVRVADPRQQRCMLVIQAPHQQKRWDDRPAALVDPTPALNTSRFALVSRRLLAEDVWLQTSVVGPFEIKVIVFDSRRVAMRPAFVDGRQWLGVDDLKCRAGFLLAVSGPPAGSGVLGRVAGDLYDGHQLYRGSKAASLRYKTERRYHVRLQADGSAVFGRGNFANTWSDRAFVGGLGVLFPRDRRWDLAADRNDASLWRAARGAGPAARVAVGQLSDGRVALVLARSLREPASGPTLVQLARWLVRLELQEAYFLDGGSAAFLTAPGTSAHGSARSFLAVYKPVTR